MTNKKKKILIGVGVGLATGVYMTFQSPDNPLTIQNFTKIKEL